MWKQKYKKTIDSIYPEPPETEISMSNVQKLTYYCQRTPDKLPKVSAELRKRIQTALKKRDSVRTTQTVQIFQSVVKNCPEFLSMCEDDLGEVLSNLSSDTAPELRGLASDLFVTYADAVSQTTAANSRMDFNLFVRRFTAFAINNLQPSDINPSGPAGSAPVPPSVTLRTKGLRALRSSARVLELRGALDNYVTMNGKDISAAIISNVRLAPSVLAPFAAQFSVPDSAAEDGAGGSGVRQGAQATSPLSSPSLSLSISSIRLPVITNPNSSGSSLDSPNPRSQSARNTNTNASASGSDDAQRIDDTSVSAPNTPTSFRGFFSWLSQSVKGKHNTQQHE